VKYNNRQQTCWCRGNALGFYSGGSPIRISAGTPAIISENFLDSPQIVKENSGIVPPSGQDR
jgi:hypothetical protein